MTTRRALITGITGQDGSYLAEFLLARGYEVVGLLRHTSTGRLERLQTFVEHVTLETADLLDEGSLIWALSKHRPHEVYNLAGQSFQPAGFSQPVLTGEVTGLGVTRLLEAIRVVDPDIRFYQASTSEMFGESEGQPFDETSPLRARSPYAIAKTYAHLMTQSYRASYDLFACCGIAFNHESPRRGEHYLTRKITKAVAEIAAGRRTEVALGNLNATRDWGFAGDYVDAMWRSLQQDEPDDYVIATGINHTIEDLLATAFGYVDRDWRNHVTYDVDLVPPIDITTSIADPSKAYRALGWRAKTSFESLIAMMIDADLAQLQA